MLTMSNRTETVGTILVRLRSNPTYRKTKILEGVVVRVEDTEITLVNENQNPVLINRATLAPGRTRTITIPTVKGWYPEVFLEIKAYDYQSPDVPTIVPNGLAQTITQERVTRQEEWS